MPSRPVARTVTSCAVDIRRLVVFTLLSAVVDEFYSCRCKIPLPLQDEVDNDEAITTDNDGSKQRLIWHAWFDPEKYCSWVFTGAHVTVGFLLNFAYGQIVHGMHHLCVD